METGFLRFFPEAIVWGAQQQNVERLNHDVNLLKRFLCFFRSLSQVVSGSNLRYPSSFQVIGKPGGLSHMVFFVAVDSNWVSDIPGGACPKAEVTVCRIDLLKANEGHDRFGKNSFQSLKLAWTLQGRFPI